MVAGSPFTVAGAAAALLLCFAHDLFGKPLRTFPDHAPTTHRIPLISPCGHYRSRDWHRRGKRVNARLFGASCGDIDEKLRSMFFSRRAARVISIT